MPPPPPPPSPVTFPLGWLLEHASAPIQYRAITEIARLETNGAVANLPYTNPSALLLAATQSIDGTWGGSMLGIPGSRSERYEGVGTVNAVRRLVEYGWQKDSPPLTHARRPLFRLLAEDEDPSLLYELTPRGKSIDAEQARHSRALLREAAAAALAVAGYEGDPRLGGAARRIAVRIGDYLRSGLAEKPWIRVGNQHVLAAEARPPSIYTLIMLAYMPLFRSEHFDLVDRIYRAVTQPMPRQDPIQQVGKQLLIQPHLMLGDPLPHRNAADADVPFALMWLELMARMGYLKQNDNWSRLYQRFLDDRDSSGVWHPHKGLATPRSTNPLVWSYYPLDRGNDRDMRWTDVTFRLGVIGRHAGRPIEII